MDSNEGKLSTPTQGPIGGGSSSVGGGGASTMDSMDWRTQLHPDARRNIVNATTKLLLKIVAPDRDKVEELAKRFEERVYTETTSKSDYINKIGEKIRTLFPKAPGNKNESPYADMNEVIKLED